MTAPSLSRRRTSAAFIFVRRGGCLRRETARRLSTAVTDTERISPLLKLASNVSTDRAKRILFGAEVKQTERTLAGGAIWTSMTGRRAVKLTQSPILQHSFVQVVPRPMRVPRVASRQRMHRPRRVRMGANSRRCAGVRMTDAPKQGAQRAYGHSASRLFACRAAQFRRA
jgi:hypothetical protein